VIQNTRKEFTVQVSANDQIGHTSPTHVRAYGAMARMSNQSTNLPFDVSGHSGTVGKSNRQNLPIPAYKIDGVDQGGPSGGNGNVIVLPLNNADDTPFQSYFANIKPGATQAFAGGKLTMGNDGYATYISPTGALVKFNKNDQLRDILIGSPEIKAELTKQYGAGALKKDYSFTKPEPIAARSVWVNSQEAWQGQQQNKAETDFHSYFANTKPGSTQDFAGGKLTMGNDGYATYISPTGALVKFNKNDPLRDIVIGSPEIKAEWTKLYGAGALKGDYSLDKNGDVMQNPYQSSEVDVFYDKYPTMAVYLASRDVNPYLTAALEQRYNAGPWKPTTGDNYKDVTGDNLGSIEGAPDFPASGQGAKDVGILTYYPGDAPEGTIAPKGSDENTTIDPNILTLPNMLSTASQPSGVDKDYGLLTGENTVSWGLDQTYGLVSNYTPSASPSFIPSQAKAPSSQNYMNTTTTILLKLADHDVIC
jgi:hypothetical protein